MKYKETPKEPKAPYAEQNGSTTWINDHPDKFEVVMNTEYFKTLKEKVHTQYKGLNTDKRIIYPMFQKNQEDISRSEKMYEKSRKAEFTAEKGFEEVSKEYELLVLKIEQLIKESKHKQLAPIETMNQLVTIKKLEVNGAVLIRGGSCDRYILGDKELIADSLKYKAVRLVFW